MSYVKGLFVSGLLLVFCSAGFTGGDAVVDRLRNAPAMIPFYTGKIYPTPQQAKYSDKFFSLGKTGLILGSNVEKGDPRIKIVTDRIAQYGGTAGVATAITDDFETFVCIGNTTEGSDVKPPEKEQGYVMKSFVKEGKNIVVLKGNDNLGLTWAVASFKQLVTFDHGKALVQQAEIFDYPVFKNRGFVNGSMRGRYAPKITGWPRAGFSSPLKEIIVDFKMSKVAFSGSILSDRRKPEFSWKTDLPEESIKDIQKTGAYLTPLGIEWYISIHNLSWTTEDLQMRSKNEDDFNAVFKKACIVMDAGGYFSIMYDDLRFPMHPDDVRDFGSAREADMYFLNKLHGSLKTKYDKPVKMLFCPPFYWGPGSGHTYPEDRDAYLNAIGDRLPEEIGIYWTGDRVKTSAKKKAATDWFTARIKRKPLYYQNTKGTSHVYWYHYVTDPIPAWRDWAYEGFYDDVDTYQLNVGFPGDLVAVLTSIDYLWNPDAYDPEKSVEQAAKKMCGVESWPLLKELNEKLSCFDEFGLRVSPYAAKNVGKMQKTMAEIDKIWEQVRRFHPAAIDEWTGMARYIQLQKGFIASLKKNPDLEGFAQNAAVSLEHATKEAKFNPETDTFLSAYEFSGGHPATFYAFRCEKRLATWIYGARTVQSKMKADFTVEPWPPSADYKLIVCAQDDDLPDNKCKIRIDVDGTVIFEGPNPFERQSWTIHEFVIPGSAMKRNSVLTISNIEDSDNRTGPPFFMLNYAVLRKTAE